MRPPKYRINLTRSEKSALEQLLRRHSTPQNKARRAQIILLANEEAKTNKDIAKHLGINLCDVTRWTKRWIDRAMEPVEARLSDSPRSGAPDRITAEQWCQIMALACEPPEEHGLPITHWTHKDTIGHSIHDLTRDVSVDGFVDDFSKFKHPKYDPKVYKRVEGLRKKLWDNVGRHYVVVLSLRGLLFDSAIRTYREEIRRLKRKIRKQSKERQVEIDHANAEIQCVSKSTWEELQPMHPQHSAANGSLTQSGVECCYSLFAMGLSDLSIAHVMRLSLKSVKRRRRRWMNVTQPGA
jgi:putative transposase